MTVSPLRFFRNLKNWTQEYVASSLKISQAAYSKLENGVTVISDENAELLATLYEVDKKIFLSDQYPLSNYNTFSQSSAPNLFDVNLKEYIDVVKVFNHNLEKLLVAIRESKNLANSHIEK